MKKIVREIENELRTLATRIEVLKKGIVQWGTFEIADGFQPYISFLRSTDGENLDLCICVRQHGAKIEISGDMVLLDGSVVAKMEPISIDSSHTEREAIDAVADFARLVEQRIVQHLSSDENAKRAKP
jgi:hypothetical protein